MPQTVQPPPAGSLVVSFIDVGQGDAVLVQPGGQSYLVDAGKPEEGPNVVDFLRSRGVESLNGIVVSNPDADHIGGFLDVLDTYQVATVYLSGDPKGTSTFNAFLRGVRDEGANVKEVRAGLYWHQHAPFTRNPRCFPHCFYRNNDTRYDKAQGQSSFFILAYETGETARIYDVDRGLTRRSPGPARRPLVTPLGLAFLELGY